MKFRHVLTGWMVHDPIRNRSLHADLISSRSGLTLEQYLWRSTKIAIIVGILFGIFGFFAGRLLSMGLLVEPGKGIYNVLNLKAPDTLDSSRALYLLKVSSSRSFLHSGPISHTFSCFIIPPPTRKPVPPR